MRGSDIHAGPFPLGNHKPIERPRPKGSAGAGYCEKERSSFAYLSGCVATACWWCQKQPPSPIATDITMAQAIKMRMAIPSYFASREYSSRSTRRM